jgi:hypothetical protein
MFRVLCDVLAVLLAYVCLACFTGVSSAYFS